MGFLQPPKQSFSNMIGASDASVGSCSFEGTFNGQRRPDKDFTATFTVDKFNRLETVDGDPVSSFAASCPPGSGANRCMILERFDALGGQCPKSWTTGVNDLFGYKLTAQSEASNSSGVFEYNAMLAAAGGLGVVLVVIMVGIILAKRSVNAVTEETNTDDDLEYYEGADGREYWRIKPKYRGEW